MELWCLKLTFGVGFLAFCFVDLRCWGRPINSGNEDSSAGVDQNGDATPVEANVAVIVVSVIGVVCIVLVLVGCLCCQKGVFKTFESLHNGRFRQGYVSQTSNEFTMFPPGGSAGQQRGSMADIKFEPLPDIRPRGRSLPTAQRPRPATFSNVINRGLSVQDWFDDPHVNFPRYQLQYLQELGSGWFGKVVEGEANGIGISPHKTKVVVKILREDATPTDQMYFLHEMKAFRDLNHPNIMKLLGKCLETDPFLIILEHCAFKDLKTYLTQHRTESESLIQGNLLLRMACNIAAGLHHMHSHGFIHTDLAARNCLVNTELQVKIGDYGNAIEKFRENYYCAGDVAVPIRWCAPESLRCTEMTIETKEVTKEANIWSFGVVLWEIIEFGKLPYFELNDDDVLQKVIIDNSTTLSQPRTSVAHKDRVYEVLKLCWLFDPQLRPNMEKVSAMLAHLHNHKDPDFSSEFEQRWNSLQPRVVPLPTRVGAGDANTNLAFESDFAASNVTAPRRSRDWDTSSSMSPVYSLSLEGDFPGTNASTISPSLQNLRGSMDDLNATSSSSVVGGRSLAEQTSVSEGDLNEGAMTHESTPDLKARSASEDLLQQRRSEEHSPRKVQREFDAWLQQQQAQGAEASHMAQQISEAIGDLDQALASEKSSESSSHHASPERDATLKGDSRNTDVDDDLDLDEEEAERRWTEMVDGTTREAAQVTELVREKSQSVQDFLKLTVIDSDNSDSDLNTPRQPPMSSSAPALDDEGAFHTVPASKLAAFATEVAGASVTAAVREASSPTPQSGNALSPLLVIAPGVATLIPAEANLTVAEKMLNGGDDVSSFDSQNGVVSEAEQLPVLSSLSSVADVNDQLPSTNIPAVTEASLTTAQGVLQLLEKEHCLVQKGHSPSPTDSSALNNFRLVLSDTDGEIPPAGVCSSASSEETCASAKSTSPSATSAFHEHDLDSTPHELIDVSSSSDVHSRNGYLASTPVRTVNEPDLSAYFANRTGDYLVNESNVDDLWNTGGVATSTECVATEDVALIMNSSSAQSSDQQDHIHPSAESALKIETQSPSHRHTNSLDIDASSSTKKTSDNGDNYLDGIHKDSFSKTDPITFFTTASEELAVTDAAITENVQCNFDEETGETSRVQSPNQNDGILLSRIPRSTESSFIPVKDYISPRDFDSEASSATMYLTCDESTQSSRYQTDSDASATTVDDSSGNECVIETVKDAAQPSSGCTSLNDTTKQADSLTSESDYLDGSKDGDLYATVNVNPSNTTITSHLISLENSCSESSVMPTPHTVRSNLEDVDYENQEGTKSSHEAEADCIGETSTFAFSDTFLDKAQTPEQLLCETSILSCATQISLPSEDIHNDSTSHSSDIPEKTSNLISFDESPKDSNYESTSHNVLSSPQPSNLEDISATFISQPLTSDDSLLKESGDTAASTTLLDLDKKQDYDNSTHYSDSKTMVLAPDQNILNLELKNEVDVCDPVSHYIEKVSEAACLDALGYDLLGAEHVEAPNETANETTIFSGPREELHPTEELVTVPGLADGYAVNSIADTSSEEEGPQEDARDSLSDGTFERATTPLVENAFTLEPVIPLEPTVNADIEDAVNSNISDMKPPASHASHDEQLGSQQASLKPAREQTAVSPSSSGLDVMSGDAETVEFEFFVAADGNGNANLQSVPRDFNHSEPSNIRKHAAEESTFGSPNTKQNTFIKFDSDIMPDNCSDYGTNVEVTSDDKHALQMVANDVLIDDEKHSEGSDSSGLSTLYEIEDIEEALADVESSEDDSPPIADVEEIDELSEAELLRVHPTKASMSQYDFADFMLSSAEQIPDSSDWNGNTQLSSWHHNGLHNFVPLHSTIEEVSEEEETISGLADAFQHAFTRIVRRISEVEMEMVSDENDGSPVLGVAPSPVKDLTLSADALIAVKNGSNGSSLIHDAVNEAMVSCVADMLDNNLVLDEGKSLKFDRKIHELSSDKSPSTIIAKMQGDIVLNNNCKNSILLHEDSSVGSEDLVNANTDITHSSSKMVNGMLDDQVDNAAVNLHNNDDSSRVGLANVKSESLPETRNSVTIEDLDVPRNGVEKVTFCPASRDSDDDVLIVDTETNEVTLLESNRPRPHLAFVRQSIAETTPFQAKTSSDGEDSESEMSSSAAEEAATSQSKLVGSRFMVVPCNQTGVVIHEELEDSSQSFELVPPSKSDFDLQEKSSSDSDFSSSNNARLESDYSTAMVIPKVEIELQDDTHCNDEQLEVSLTQDFDSEIANADIAHSVSGWLKDEAQLDLPSVEDSIEKCVLDDLKSCYNTASALDDTFTCELPVTPVTKLEPSIVSREVLIEAEKLEPYASDTTSPFSDDKDSNLEGILKFASMSTVDHETETIPAVTSKNKPQVDDLDIKDAKACEGIVLDVMESDPEDELVALVPVCADANEKSPLRIDDYKCGIATPDVCYTPDWESDTDTSSSQSSSSTSGEFEVNKSTKPSDPSEELAYAPLTNILELVGGDDDHSDDELDPETRRALEAFQPSEWNKNATPSRGLLRSPEKKSDGKKSVSFKMQKCQVIYEYPKEDKSWEEEHASSRSSWSDQVYDPQMDFTNSIDWELGDDEIPEDIVEVEDFDDGTQSYDPAPVYRLRDDALYRLSNFNYEDDTCDAGRNGVETDVDGNEGEVVMYDAAFQQFLEQYGNNPDLFGSAQDRAELWPEASLTDSSFFVNCSTDSKDPFKLDAQQFYNAHYLPQYFIDSGHNYYPTGEGGEPDPRAHSQEDEAYLETTPESDYMLHRFGPAAAGFHYYDPVMGVNMFVGNGENDDYDFADALDRMIQKEQNGGSLPIHNSQNDGNNGDDSDSDDIPSFEVKPQKSSVLCDTSRSLGTTATTIKTTNELNCRNESGENSINNGESASCINMNGLANGSGHDRPPSSEVSTTTNNNTDDSLSPHSTDSGLGTPSIDEITSSPSLTAAASSSSVSLDATRTCPAVVETASQELLI